ncbi:MAG: substrate-binding domain-containing protein [Oscillospiraceae bacterium]|nr:substrate-binding domain-containing protein [Oscillospiraceae bacterium]
MKKILTAALAASLMVASLSGCGTSSSGEIQPSAGNNNPQAAQETPQSESANSNFDFGRLISVVSREDGSGTRGAFIELFGVEVRDGDNRTDMTTKEAIIADKTDIMMTNVSSDTYAIGYISLGSLNNSVKALSIDGAAASVDNIENGSYQIQRPFNIATKKDGISEAAQDFVDFILSAEGQAVVEGSYIAVDGNAPAFEGSQPAGKIVVSGSSSVTPIMERLREAYLEINPNATVEVQMSDSSAGMTAAINGTCDIGMASRELKDSELAELNSIAIAIDGLAVIVNNGNPVNDLSKEMVRQIFTGEIENWSGVATQ